MKETKKSFYMEQERGAAFMGMRLKEKGTHSLPNAIKIMKSLNLDLRENRSFHRSICLKIKKTVM